MIQPLLFALLVVCNAGELDKIDLTKDVPGSRVVRLTDFTFDSVKSGGDWFVKFFAPWCGHCKHLHQPWEDLAHAFNKKINIAKIDTTSEKATADAYGIKSYPALLYFRHGNTNKPLEYKGGRKLDTLKSFVRTITGEILPTMDQSNFKKLRQKTDASFLLVCPEAGCPTEEVAAVRMAAYQTAENAVSFSTTTISKVPSDYGVSSADKPVLVRWRDHDTPLVYSSSVPVSSEGADYDALIDWVKDNSLGLVTTINDPHFYSALHKTKKLVVLGLQDDFKSKPKDPRRKVLQDVMVSLALKHQDQYSFGLLEGDTWEGFISYRFGARVRMPRIVVLDGDNVHYELPDDLPKSAARIEAAITPLLNSVSNGEAQSSAIGLMAPAYSFLARFSRYGVVNALEHHWQFVVASFFGGVVALWLMFKMLQELCSFEEANEKRD